VGRKARLPPCCPPTTLWLGHRRKNSRDHLTVGTTTEHHPTGVDGDLVFAVAFALSERMRPDRSTTPLPPGFNKVQMDYVVEVAEGYQTWPTMTCEVDGTNRLLRYWRYAGGWCGFVTGLPEVSIKLVGAGVEPTGLRLATVREPSLFDFDPTERLHLSQLTEARRRRPEASLPLPWSTALHPDQSTLLEQHGLR
jgi:hypothetical protein